MSDKTVVLNAKKMNFDGNLDFSVLSSDVTVYDDTTPDQLLERIEGADIIVTKEMPVNGDLIRKFPASVKLICEAGTGYNNLDLDAVFVGSRCSCIHENVHIKSFCNLHSSLSDVSGTDDS